MKPKQWNSFKWTKNDYAPAEFLTITARSRKHSNIVDNFCTSSANERSLFSYDHVYSV